MKASLGQVYEQVRKMSLMNHDEVVQARDIRFESLDTVMIGTDRYAFLPNAQRQIATRYQVPHNYLQRCPQELQEKNLNHWLNNEKNDSFFVRFNDKGVRAIFTPRYKPMDNMELIKLLFAKGYTENTRTIFGLDDGMMKLNLQDDPVHLFQINGEQFLPGRSFVNSEVGLYQLTPSLFILRLVCTNGLISRVSISLHFRHISRKFIEDYDLVMARFNDELIYQKSQIGIALNSPVREPLILINRFNERFKVTDSEKVAMEWAWPFEKGETMFNVVNTYTKAAQYPTLTAEESFRLEKIGGNILGLLSKGDTH